MVPFPMPARLAVPVAVMPVAEKVPVAFTVSVVLIVSAHVATADSSSIASVVLNRLDIISSPFYTRETFANRVRGHAICADAYV